MTIILSIGTMLLGGSGVGVFMHYRQNDRAKKIANDTALIQQWKQLYEEAERKS
ncbi:MAG: hypothetical protein R3Y68_10535 [Rikenellaceae bacterium]